MCWRCSLWRQWPKKRRIWADYRRFWRHFGCFWRRFGGFGLFKVRLFVFWVFFFGGFDGLFGFWVVLNGFLGDLGVILWFFSADSESFFRVFWVIVFIFFLNYCALFSQGLSFPILEIRVIFFLSICVENASVFIRRIRRFFYEKQLTPTCHTFLSVILVIFFGHFCSFLCHFCSFFAHFYVNLLIFAHFFHRRYFTNQLDRLILPFIKTNMQEDIKFTNGQLSAKKKVQIFFKKPFSPIFSPIFSHLSPFFNCFSLFFNCF